MNTSPEMDELVIKADSREEQWTSERCFIREIVNTPRVPEYSLAEARVEPGITTELHALSVDEWYIMVRGTGLVEIAGADGHAVGPGDVVAIPAGASQRISNEGDEDLVFQCMCLPRFTPECYESLE